MRRLIFFLGIGLLFFFSSVFANGNAVLLNLSGPIGPASQDYVQRGIETAQNENASVIILQIDTPGGLESAMRNINNTIISSSVPVIAYVAPSGARAASAGTFLVYASHLAAMAPGTHIGAASPVNLLSPATGANSPTTLEKKAMNDAVAYIRTLAELRGRNADWAESAVRNAATLTATQALQLHVIDVIADNPAQLLQKLDGRTVVVNDIQQKIQSKNLQIQTVTADWRYDFLSFITDPNIAYLLLLIAIYGLFFEFSNPGMVLPGVAGIIALLLVLYAFQLMPINYAGLTLILLGIAFMIFEMYVMSFGVIGIGGVIAFILGSIMLFNVHDPNYRLTLGMIGMMSLITIAFFFLVLTLAFRSHKKAVVTGREGLIGSEGFVISVMNEQVIVRVLGEIWEARSSVMLNPGDRIKVTGVSGLILIVEPAIRPIKPPED